MRRLLIVPSIVAALLFALAIGLAGCGASAQNAALGDDQTPAGILAASLESSSTMTSGTADFDVSVSFDVDQDQLSAEELAFVGQPITLSGQMAFAQDPLALDLTLDASLAGQPLSLGMKMVDGKAYLSLGGQWYEAPAEMMQAFTDSASQTDYAEQMDTMLTELGIDPATWMKDVKDLGDEEIDGIATYHLQATPDLAVIFTDVFKLIQSPQFMGMLGQAGSSADSGASMELLPSLDGLGDLQTQLPQMFSDLKAEAWIAKDSLQLMKAVITAQIVPPAGEDAAGVNAVNLSVGLGLAGINEPVSVQAPESAGSWDDFQKALQNDPSLLGPLGALSGVSLGGASFGIQ